MARIVGITGARVGLGLATAFAVARNAYDVARLSRVAARLYAAGVKRRSLGVNAMPTMFGNRIAPPLIRSLRP
jgi:NADP-dependent 3-hydroxy acid dehydrogenase YdfG